MNHVLNAIKERSSCRDYTPDLVDNEDLSAIAAAAIQAPSARNRQPWRVIVLSSPEAVAKLENAALDHLATVEPGAHKAMTASGNGLFNHAPSAFLIAAQRAEDITSADLDVGIVTSHITLAAQGMGLGSCVNGFAILAFKGDQAAQLRADFGIPDGFEPAVSVLVGHAASHRAPHHPDPDKIIWID